MRQLEIYHIFLVCAKNNGKWGPQKNDNFLDETSEPQHIAEYLNIPTNRWE
jgi:hypothetical protein